MKSKEQRGSLYAILSGLLYGSVGYFGLSAMNGNLSASNMLFWRFLISSILIFIILIPQLKSITDSCKEMFIAFINGAFYYSFSTLLYFFSSQYIGSGLSMVIFFTYPVIIMLLNYFFYGQAIPKVYYFAIVIIMAGMILLIDLNDAGFDLFGIILGLGAAFFYACYIISSKKNNISPNVSTLMVCSGCMLTCFLVTIFSNTFVIPATTVVWINLLGIGVISTIIPILLMLHSLKYITTEKASILSVLEPVFVVLLGALLLGEHLELRSGLGIILILAGALITLFSHKIVFPPNVFFKNKLTTDQG